MENLPNLVSIKRCDNLSELAQLSINKFTKPDIVLDRPPPTTTAHKKLKIWLTKGILNINQQQGRLWLILISLGDVVFLCPLLGSFSQLLIGNSPNVTHSIDLEMLG